MEDAKKNQEPDIVFHSGVAKSQETDITVVNPCAGSYIVKTKRNSSKAAEDVHARKCRKYLERATQRGHSFTPLVFETHGRMHEDVRTLLHTFAANTVGRSGLAVRDMALDLALTLVRSNAMRSRNDRSFSAPDFLWGAKAPPVAAAGRV